MPSIGLGISLGSAKARGGGFFHPLNHPDLLSDANGGKAMLLSAWPDWKGSEGTIVFRAVGQSGDTAITLANIDGGTINSNGTFRLHLGAKGEMFYTADPSATEFSLYRTTETLDLTVPHTIGFTWSDKHLHSSTDGLATRSGDMPTSAADYDFVRLLLGSGSWFTEEQRSGIEAILDVYLLPYAVSDAQLQAFTGA
jgi:hypothetical protein